MSQQTETDTPSRAPSPMMANLLTLGGMLAAFGIASCCALPLILASLGVAAAWLGGIGLIAASYRDLIYFAAIVCLLGGALMLWRQHRQASRCEPGRACATRAQRSMTLAGLIAGGALLGADYFYG